MEYQKFFEMANYIREKTLVMPDIGVILKSELFEYANSMDNKIYINYKDIPNIPQKEKNSGVIVIGQKFGKNIIIFQDTIHAYDGFTQREVAIPIFIMRLLGIQCVILTSAAGGVNEIFSAGTLMLISDHINGTGSNPLVGVNMEELGTRYPDMSNVYDEKLRKKILLHANEDGIEVEEGVLYMFLGPCYETPSEVHMAWMLGADAVGMASVPEAIAANYCGMKIIGISCIANLASGMSSVALTHLEVLETTAIMNLNFTNLLDLIFKKIL